VGPRFIFTAFILAFGATLVFATLTTLRHVNMHTSAVMRGPPRG
jgi:hypothetical protein